MLRSRIVDEPSEKPLDPLREQSAYAEEMIKNYREKFVTVVAALKTRIALGDPRTLPEHLGSGANTSVFRIEVEGKSYAAKLSNDTGLIDFTIRSLLRAKGISRVAHLAGYSFEDGVVVMQLLPGTDITKFSPEETPAYSDQDILQLIEIIRELDANGLEIDPKPSNFMYDPEQGFSVLDYHLKNDSYGIAREIKDLLIPLTYTKSNKIDGSSLNQHLTMVVRFFSILKMHYPDIFIDWLKQREADKQNPKITGADSWARRYYTQYPELDANLKKLESMGIS
jgi:hypothetical protein